MFSKFNSHWHICSVRNNTHPLLNEQYWCHLKSLRYFIPNLWYDSIWFISNLWLKDFMNFHFKINIPHTEHTYFWLAVTKVITVEVRFFREVCANLAKTFYEKSLLHSNNRLSFQTLLKYILTPSNVFSNIGSSFIKCIRIVSRSESISSKFKNCQWIFFSFISTQV